MLVIGVIDLIGGRAVHARAGRRDSYAPVTAVAGRAIEAGDAGTLARLYLDDFGVDALYVADLDAILGRTPQRTAIAAVAALGAPLWVDAGVNRLDQARATIDSGASQVIVGLETLTSEARLADICRGVGGHRVALSIDLRDGEPIGADAVIRNRDAASIAGRAVAVGVGSLIVIDLARVGMGTGLDVKLLSRVRAAAPGVTLVAGGGVRGIEDVAALGAAECDGVLVASAILGGRMSAADVAVARWTSRHDSDVR
jgi:phosphoribosylformimino-5-aminoimidazole carboxamide ribotide isomerase